MKSDIARPHNIHASVKGLKLLEGVLEEKRREIIKEWIKSGRIEGI